MKCYFFIVILFACCVGNLNAQTGKINGLELSTTYLKMSNSYRVETGMDYQRTVNLHSWSLGLRFQMKSNLAETNSDQINISGIHGSYHYSIPTILARIQLEANVHLGYRMYSNVWAANYYSSEDKYIPINSSSLEHFIFTAAGYGLRVNIFRNIYIQQDFGAGLFVSKLVTGRNNVGDQIGLNNVEHDFRRYGSQGLILTASLGVGIQF